MGHKNKTKNIRQYKKLYPKKENNSIYYSV